MMWKKTIALGAATIAALTSRVLACNVLNVEPQSVDPGTESTVTLTGSAFPSSGVSVEFVVLPSGTGPISASQVDVVSSSELRVTIPAGALTQGSLYGVNVKDGGAATICSMGYPQGLYASPPVILSEFYGRKLTFGETVTSAPDLADLNPALSPEGKETIYLAGSNFYAAEEDQVKVRFSSTVGSQVDFSIEVSGKVISAGGNRYVETVTPAIPVPDNWCGASAPSGCLNSFTIQVSLSLNAGVTYTSPDVVTISHKDPTRVAFLLKSKDDRWSQQVNDGRLALENVFGASVDVSTVVATSDSDEAKAVMIQWCKDGYDLVVPSSVVFSRISQEVSMMEECYKGGAAKRTYFAGAGTSASRMTQNHARGYGRTFETRYLIGLTAGFVLKGLEDKGDNCVGFITPSPTTYEEQANSFIIGCREAFPACKLKVVMMGSFFEPEAERDAAIFLRKQENCRIMIQHTDSEEPQKYFVENDGFAFGYNYDLRPSLGDRILSAELIDWTAMFTNFILQVKTQQWQGPKQLWYGFREGGTSIADFFSPFVPAFGQEYIRRKVAELQAGTEKIYCGNLTKNWVMKLKPGTTGFSDDAYEEQCPRVLKWAKYADVAATDSRYLWDTSIFTNNGVPASGVLQADDCIEKEEYLSGSHEEGYNNYLLEGVELIEPIETEEYGEILGGDSECATSFFGASLGQGYLKTLPDLPLCDATFYSTEVGSCNAATVLAPVNITFNDPSVQCGVGKVGEKLVIVQDPVATDPDCTYVPPSSSPATIGIVFTVVGVSFNAIVVILLLWFRNNRAVRLTQPMIVVWMAIGGVILCASNVLFIGEPSNVLCGARVIVFNLAFDLVFAMLVGKIYRIFKLFQQVEKLRRIIITDKDILIGAFALIFVDVIILSLWMILDRPQPVFAEEEVLFPVRVGNESWTDGYFPVVCSTSDGFKYATLFYKVLLIFIACTYVFMARNVPSTFVEHRFIIFSAYNTALFAGVVLLLIENSDPQTAFIIQCAGTALGSSIVNGSLALPRILVATNIWNVDSSSAFGTGGGSASGSNSEKGTAPVGYSTWNTNYLASKSKDPASSFYHSEDGPDNSQLG